MHPGSRPAAVKRIGLQRRSPRHWVRLNNEQFDQPSVTSSFPFRGKQLENIDTMLDNKLGVQRSHSGGKSILHEQHPGFLRWSHAVNRMAFLDLRICGGMRQSIGQCASLLDAFYHFVAPKLSKNARVCHYGGTICTGGKGGGCQGLNSGAPFAPSGL